MDPAFALEKGLSSLCDAERETCFVNLSVAVVVFAVTHFLFGCGSITSGPTTVHTDTLTFATSCRACVGKSLIDFAVAVVVDVVASFSLGQHLSKARSPVAFVGAVLVAALTRASSLRSFRATVTKSFGSSFTTLRCGHGSWR